MPNLQMLTGAMLQFEVTDAQGRPVLDADHRPVVEMVAQRTEIGRAIEDDALHFVQEYLNELSC